MTARKKEAKNEGPIHPETGGALAETEVVRTLEAILVLWTTAGGIRVFMAHKIVHGRQLQLDVHDHHGKP